MIGLEGMDIALFSCVSLLAECGHDDKLSRVLVSTFVLGLRWIVVATALVTVHAFEVSDVLNQLRATEQYNTNFFSESRNSLLSPQSNESIESRYSPVKVTDVFAETASES